VAGESAAASDDTASVRQRVRALGRELGRPLKLLVGKPGSTATATAPSRSP
jgi:hypothetical protein